MDEISRVLLSAILDEIQNMKREDRILREAMETIRLQMNVLTRDILALASALDYTLPRIDGSGAERH